MTSAQSLNTPSPLGSVQPVANARLSRRCREALIESATPERMRKAGNAARIETFEADVEVVRGGRMLTHSVTRQRLRIEDAPLSRLLSRGLLAGSVCADADTRAANAVAGAAAERYRVLWLAAGLQPLHAIDIASERVSGGRGGLLRTERQVANFQAFGRAADMLGKDVRRVIDAVVLHEREPAEVGREMSGYRQDKQATAVALYLLRAGLAALALHFGLTHRRTGLGNAA